MKTTILILACLFQMLFVSAQIQNPIIYFNDGSSKEFDEIIFEPNSIDASRYTCKVDGEKEKFRGAQVNSVIYFSEDGKMHQNVHRSTPLSGLAMKVQEGETISDGITALQVLAHSGDNYLMQFSYHMSSSFQPFDWSTTNYSIIQVQLLYIDGKSVKLDWNDDATYTMLEETFGECGETAKHIKEYKNVVANGKKKEKIAAFFEFLRNIEREYIDNCFVDLRDL